MRKLSFGLVLIALLLAPGHGDARADEEPAKDAAKDPAEQPSPLQDLTEEQLAEETTPADPIEYLKSFRDWLARHEKAPPRTRNDSALYDIWRAALRPRATRMRKRIETLMQRKHWLPEQGMPERVKPASWSRFVREMAGLTTELSGALKQYESARIKIRRGVPTERLRPVGSYYGYAQPVAVWRRSVLRRVALIRRHAVSVHVGPLVLHSYWNLMRRFRLGWDWRIHHCAACERRREEAQRARDAQRKEVANYIAERQRLFDTTRDTLQQQLLALQVLAAAMQAQEEQRLGSAWQARFGDAARPADDASLLAMEAARIEGEQFTGASSAAYGQLLRNWVRAYKQVLAQLAKADAKK